ncbi:MAG: STAS domain-containing protein [Methylococcales bacterium]|nr:STAS domain-containing protein [Methylococcales bacterium]
MSDFQISRSGDTLSIAGVLDFTTASEVLEAVTPAIRDTESLTVDLGGVSSSNSAALALMVEWLGLARRNQHSVRFQAVPDGIRQLAVVCQVDSLI